MSDRYDAIRREMAQMGGESRTREDVVSEVNAWGDGTADELFGFALREGLVKPTGETLGSRKFYKWVGPK